MTTTCSKVEGGIHAELKIFEVPRWQQCIEKRSEQRHYSPSLDRCMLICEQDSHDDIPLWLIYICQDLNVEMYVEMGWDMI